MQSNRGNNKFIKCISLMITLSCSYLPQVSVTSYLPAQNIPALETWPGLNTTGISFSGLNYIHNACYYREGLVPDVYNSVAEQLNFTYTLQPSTDGYFGSKDKVCVRFS